MSVYRAQIPCCDSREFWYSGEVLNFVRKVLGSDLGLDTFYPEIPRKFLYLLQTLGARGSAAG